jgi:transcriptional regulator with XRE-family HTH domain
VVYIHAWCDVRDMTLEQLGEKIDMTASYLSQLGNGVHFASQEALEAIARALSCSVADLFHDPRDTSYKLWTEIREMRPAVKTQALRIVRALESEAD